MKYFVVIFTTLVVFGLQLGHGQELKANNFTLTLNARNLAKTYVEKNNKESESDGPEIFIAMAYAIRHEKIPQPLLERILNRANSGKIGGLFDKDSLKTYGASLVADFHQHEFEHQKNEAEQNQQIRELQERLKLLESKTQ